MWIWIHMNSCALRLYPLLLGHFSFVLFCYLVRVWIPRHLAMDLGGLHLTKHFHLYSSPYPMTVLSRYHVHSAKYNDLRCTVWQVWVNILNWVNILHRSLVQLQVHGPWKSLLTLQAFGAPAWNPHNGSAFLSAQRANLMQHMQRIRLL